MKNLDARTATPDLDYDELVSAGMHPDDAKEFVRINSIDKDQWTTDDAEKMRILRARYKHLFEEVSNETNTQKTLTFMHADVRGKTLHTIEPMTPLSAAA